MLRDFKFLRRNPVKKNKAEEVENVPLIRNPRVKSNPKISTDSYRAPLNTIQEPSRIPKSISDHDSSGFKPEKVSRTPTKPNPQTPFRTPDKQGTLSKYSNGNTPSSARSRVARANLSSCNPPAVVNTVEVPCFELMEDPSFWMERNVQVLIRVRPLNNMEKSSFGYSRCLKQESGESITWIGQPETRFTYDHVACEAIDQEMLFRMVGLPMVENCLSGYNSCMFAYGQTGSGKTHTMLGEIEELEVKPSPNRGMTPRIFEFLFARTRAEEEIRRDEHLKYNCKCSFLEIYNEQITDLLDPSSTNLMLREDMKNGVYVENLSESEVHTVGDILQLLTQGASNRKVAATNMNRESSRSHSVFTCVIKSTWEKDSATNFRFARLNLVDLAGSERQKSSGAEGERLKEAANINKSLSTLGHVIMALVDVANGKPRHIPYRDSRLTFLLQDSLGGNSKTMIIANVSPSICSAAETLNTLKFAQRAKLIQNNAIINEDSSGEDVVALKHQIQLLKEELSALKHENATRSLSFGEPFIDTSIKHEDDDCSERMYVKENGVPRVSFKQLRSLEATLAGALRREQTAETTVHQLQAEIHQLNRLVSQREEDTKCRKMILKFREDKIRRMESVLGGMMPMDDYLVRENKALSEENQLLGERVDKNPEVTRFAVENIRLLDQVRQFQDLYEEGEKEMLLNEVCELRNQLISSLDGNLNHPNHLDMKVSNFNDDENNLLHEELKITLSELEGSKEKLNCCLEENAKLQREIEDLRSSLSAMTREHDSCAEVIKESIVGVPMINSLSIMTTGGEKEGTISESHVENIMDLQVELDIVKIILQEQRSCVIVHLQEELAGIQQEVYFSKAKETETNERLMLLEIMREEWDVIACEMEHIMSGGDESLRDVSDQIDVISGSIHRKKSLVSGKIGRLKKYIFEKEVLIEELSQCLKEALNRRDEMECMLSSLRGAALVMTEAHQQECCEKNKEIFYLTSELNSKASTIEELRSLIERGKDQLKTASSCATAAFVVVNRLWESNCNYQALVIDGPENEILETRKNLTELDFVNDYVKQSGCKSSRTGTRMEEDNDDVNSDNLSSFAIELLAKDFELLILSSELKQLALLKEDAEKARLCTDGLLESLKKDIVFKGLEAASNSRDQKDKMEEVLDSLSALKRDYELKSFELQKALAEGQSFEAQLQEKAEKIFALELDLSRSQERAEIEKVNAEEKEKEARLLERSIEELEITINVLEQKVDIVKGEAESQRRQREELELELLGVKEQMQNIKTNDSDLKRCLDEKEMNHKESLLRVQLLEKEIAARDAEISRCKAHICELNSHAEAQASEHKQRFRALEAMVERLKSEVSTTHGTSSPKGLEKIPSKSRAPGSPFKWIGLGLTQQTKSEKDEELTAGRQRIEELEDLAISRQKELLMLKAKLASAESMTHDVIRDLLGVKLNMKNYTNLVDNQKLPSLMGKAQHCNVDAEVKDQEVANLKQQINEFATERNGWLEEIERKQPLLMAAHVALEKLRQHEELLATENEMLKTENADCKKKLMGLEVEVAKLSGHHHAKIQEENNLLRFKLRRTEAILSRVKDELASGKSSYINFEEEEQLDKKLKETEEEKLRLAQKLLGLCTAVLKAAGVTKPTSEISISVAEETLVQLKNRVISLEMELEDVKIKVKNAEM